MKSSVGSVTLTAPTLESLNVDLFASASPVDTAPGFAITAEGTLVTAATSYTAGSWATAYGTVLVGTASVADPGWTTARTPTLGVSGAIVIASGSRYWLWAKTSVGSEVAIERVGTLVVL